MNSRLAQHYGIRGIKGLELRKGVLPPDARRGGVITHGSILKLTTNSSYTSPVKRGAWIMERIIGKPPSPPPPNVKAVEQDTRVNKASRSRTPKSTQLGNKAGSLTAWVHPGGQCRRIVESRTERRTVK